MANEAAMLTSLDQHPWGSLAAFDKKKGVFTLLCKSEPILIDIGGFFWAFFGVFFPPLTDAVGFASHDGGTFLGWHEHDQSCILS